MVAVTSGAKVRLSYHWLREAAKFLETPVPRRPESIHIVEQYLDVARFLGANSAEVRFPFHIPTEEAAIVESLLANAGLSADAKFVTLNPASARREKEWSAANFAALADEIFTQSGTPAVLVTADTDAAQRVIDAAKNPIVNLAGRTNLKQLADVLRRGAAHVCGDTGSGHIAAALGVPVVSLFGPTGSGAFVSLWAGGGRVAASRSLRSEVRRQQVRSAASALYGRQLPSRRRLSVFWSLNSD